MAYTYERPNEEYDSYVSSPYTERTYYTWPSGSLTPDSPRSGSSHTYSSDVSGTSSSRRRRREEREATTHLTSVPGVYVNVTSPRRRGGRRGSLVVYGEAPITPRRSPEAETRIFIGDNSPPRHEHSGRVARPVIHDSRRSSRELVGNDAENEDRPREPRRRTRSHSADRQVRSRSPSHPPSFERVYSWSDEETSARRRASRSRSRRRKPTLKVEFADQDEIIEAPAVSAVPRALSADTRTSERQIRNHNRRIDSRPAVPDPVIVHEYKRGHVDVPVHRRRLSREERDYMDFEEQRERLIRRQEPGRAKRRESVSRYAPQMSSYY